MNCRSCGREAEDGTKFCVWCGARLESASATSAGDAFANSPLGSGSASFDVASGYDDAPTPEPPAPDDPENQAPTPDRGMVDARSYLIPNIVMLFLCTPVWFFSIIGVYYSIRAELAKATSDLEKFRRATIAKSLFWFNLVAALAFYALFFYGLSYPDPSNEQPSPSVTAAVVDVAESPEPETDEESASSPEESPSAPLVEEYELEKHGANDSDAAPDSEEPDEDDSTTSAE
ncbi:MAG: hypothetical protein ACOX0A_10580 [Thermoguttaceae bacterium]|jgi:hypothetical protein